MQVQEQANFGHAKGSCYRCGQVSPVVDLDCYIEGEGVLALCFGCVADAARLAGFVTEGEAADAAIEVNRLRAEAATMADIIESAQKLIRTLETASTTFRKKVASGV